MGRRKRRLLAQGRGASPPPVEASLDWTAPDLRREWRYPLAVVIALMGLYAYSMPRTVTLEDSGIFIMSCFFAGISHPPGYPIHSLLGNAAALLPVGSIALRIHLLSAAFGAATCAVLWSIAFGLTRSRTAALAAALGFGVSRVFWSQAIIAEVYTLNTFMFFLLMALCLDHAAGKPNRLEWIGLVTGLGLSHHYPLFLLGAPLLACVMWPARFTLIGSIRRLLPWLLLGLTPYLYVVVRSWTDPPISFYGPLDTLGRVLHFIGRRGYSLVEGSPSAGWEDKTRLAGFLSVQIAEQYQWLGLALAACGFVVGWKRWPPRIGLGLLAAFLGSSYLLLLLLKFDYELTSRTVFLVYPMIPYGVMALWIAQGIAEVERRASAARPALGPATGALLVALLAGTNLVAHASVDVRKDYVWAREFALAVLNSLEPQAVLFTHGDSDTGPIGYLNRVEGVRPDVEVFNDQGLVFSNRLFHPPVTYEAREQALSDFIEQQTRPVYYMAEIRHRFGTEYLGPLVKVRKDLPRGKQVFTGNRVLLDYFERVLAQEPPQDSWTLGQRNQLLDNFTGLAAPMLHLATDPEARLAHQGLLDRLTQHYAGKLKLIEVMMNVEAPERLLEWADSAERLLDEDVSKANRARLFSARAHVLLRMKRPADAEASLERAAAIYSHPTNPAVVELLGAYVGAGKREPYAHLRTLVFGAGPVPPEVSELDRKLRSR